MDCIFCKITQKKIPADIVFENELLMVFKDINPKTPIHLLTVPKKHIVSVGDMADSDAGLMGELILEARNTAQRAGLDGYKLLFNVGRRGGQIIDHVHLHILGGWDNNSNPNLVKI